jgi:hypothetical protein
MKTLLALRAAGNSGKSKTLCMLIEMIKSAYPEAILDERRFKVDVTIIITINGTKVGIETQGDPNSRLPKSLKEFIEVNCKVIVCAARTIGQTVAVVNKAADSGYQIKWFDKARVSDSREQAAANRTVAGDLFVALKAALAV